MTKGHFLSFFCRICVQSRHGKPCHHTHTCKRCPRWWPMDEYGEYTWGWGCPTMQYPLQFTLGSLLWCSCDFVPVLNGILQRYSDIGMTGRYLGGFKVCIMLFFGGNIWKAYWVPNLSINLWGIQNNLKIGTVWVYQPCSYA